MNEAVFTTETGDAPGSLGERPIQADRPAGSSVRSEECFEALSQEVAKHESMTADDVDWERVVSLARDILANRSKDLLVAVYYCRGVFSTDGYAGLAQALNVVDAMVEHYWDDMEPPPRRMRGRVAALGWLMEKLTDAVRQRPAGPDQEAAVRHCLATIDAMGARLAMLGLTLDSAALKRAFAPAERIEPIALKADKHETQETASEPDGAESGGPGELTPAARQADSTVTMPTTPAITPQKVDPELRRMIRRCVDEMRKLASVWIERDLRDTRAYRFARLGTWSAVEKVPRNDNGVVDLPPPPRNRLNTALSLYQQKRFPEFIVEAEALVSKHVFWLDGHRLIAAALNALGEQFEPAAHAVVGEVLAFVARAPEVVDLSFSDGSPFADAGTRAWIEQERQSLDLKEGGGEVALDAGIAEAWGRMVDNVVELADNGDFSSVAGLFAARVEAATNQREVFQWRLHEAAFYHRYGRDDVVLGIVDGLLGDVERHALAQWEPALALSLASLGVRCADRLAKTGSSDHVLQVRRRAFELLCRLDPGTALNVLGAG